MGDIEELCFSESEGVLGTARLISRPLPIVEEIALWLLADNYPTESVSAHEYASTMSAPPYWAFCWGGGQALARYIFDVPSIVENKRVIDFGAGSGVAAIAAKLQGAKSSLAVDCDPKALNATSQNARLNHVQIDVAQSMPDSGLLREEYDLILAADICYEESGMEWLMDYLKGRACDGGPTVVLADSRYPDLHNKMEGLKKVSQYTVRTFPDLDEAEQFDCVTIYQSE